MAQPVSEIDPNDRVQEIGFVCAVRVQ